MRGVRQGDTQTSPPPQLAVCGLLQSTHSLGDGARDMGEGIRHEGVCPTPVWPPAHPLLVP